MKKSLFVLFLFIQSLAYLEILQAQSVFDDYGIRKTCLGAAPFASLKLDALDFNPAGNVFLREGWEFSANNVLPCFQTIENRNTFIVKDYVVNRMCVDNNTWWVPSPSAKLSFRNANNAFSISYTHSERVMESEGNTCFDDMVQKVIPWSTEASLMLLSLQLFSFNGEANQLSELMKQQYGVYVKAPFSKEIEFPTALMSSSSQYGSRSDRISVGYSRRFDIGDDNNWKQLSLYSGLKYQRLSLFQTIYTSPYCVDTENQSVISVRDICLKYKDYYNALSNVIPDLSYYFSNMADRFDGFEQSCDTMFLPFPCTWNNNNWGVNALFGFNVVHSYWNMASTIEFGTLPFKLCVGYSRNIGRFQVSLGGVFGYADVNYGAYSQLFHKQLGFNLDNYWYGDIGTEVAFRLRKTDLTIKVGNAFGFNKDMLLCNGYEVLLKKHNITYSPSCGVEWQASSLITLVGGFTIYGIPLCGKEFGVEGVINSSAKCVVREEYHFSLGFVTHIE